LVRGVLTSTKSHQRRRVDMSAQLFAVLLDWRRQQRARWLKKGKPVPEWVFPSLEGTALEERNVRHVFTRMLEKAELRKIRVHDTPDPRCEPGRRRSARRRRAGATGRNPGAQPASLDDAATIPEMQKLLGKW
jgi:integrase